MLSVETVESVATPSRTVDARDADRLFLVRRNLPDPGEMGFDGMDALASQVHWVEGFATSDRVMLVYSAPNEAVVRRHAELNGLTEADIVEVKRRRALRPYRFVPE